MEHLNALEAAFPNLTPEEQKMYLCKIRKLHGFFRGIVEGPTVSPPNCGKLWSSTDDTKVIELYANGKTFQEISQEFGRSPGAITSRLKKLCMIILCDKFKNANDTAPNGSAQS